MSYFEWTDGLRLGQTEIDEQHKKLLSLGEAVMKSRGSSDPETAGLQALRDLLAFAQKHFSFEERLMRTKQYPEFEEHRRQHAELLGQLSAYCSEREAVPEARLIAEVTFLWNWLFLHINSADRDLVAWLGGGEARSSR